MDGVNGYLYGNLQGLNICLGDKVDWHIMSFGTEADIHTVYFHGNVLVRTNQFRPFYRLSVILFALRNGNILRKYLCD